MYLGHTKLTVMVDDRCRVVVSVSTSRSRDVPTSRLGLVSRKIVNVSASSRSRPFTSRAQDQFSAKYYCAGHSMQCERALGVVSQCCSYYIAHHINTLKTMNVKDNI